MNAVVTARGRPLAALVRIEHAILCVAVAALATLSVLVLAAPGSFDLPRLVAGTDLGTVVAGTCVYTLGHVFRFLRLALLTYRGGVRLRRVLQVHLLTAGLAVMLPFKLSDLVRVRGVGVVLDDVRAGIVTVWLERALDAAVLTVLIGVCAAAVPGSLELLTPLLVVLCVFVALTAVLLTIVPPNLRLVMLHVLRREGSERDVKALVALRQVLATIRPAPDLLRGRAATLVLLSVLIWGAEVAAVSVAVPGIGAELSQLSTGLLSLLSSVSSGATALFPSSGERLSEALVRVGTGSGDVSAYRAVLTITPLIAGTIGGVAYLRRLGGVG